MRVPVQRKVEIINSILNEDKRAAVAALEIGVSKKTIYSWLNRYKNSQPSKRHYALSPLYKKGITHPRASVIHAQKLILRLIVAHPEWGCRKISTYLKAHGYNIGYFAVYSFLKSKSSSTSDLRRNNQRLWAGPGRLSSDIKLSVVKQCITGEKTITEVANEHHLARKTVYSWIHLYKNALSLDETGVHIFADKYANGEKHPRSLSSSVSADILDMVIGKPELSIHQLSEICGVSSWSVWRILKEHNLSTYQSRCLYANEKQKEFLPIYPTKTADSVSGSIWEAFTPNLAPAPPPVNLSSNNRFTLHRFLGLFTSSFILSVIVLYIINVYLQADGISDVIGASFSIVSLFFGTCLFFYSLKYYITLFIILSNSRTGMQASSIKMSLIERLFGIEVTIEDDSGLPDITNSKNNGLIYDLSAITLERLPFVSIHISTYNEKRVINRLLTAATSMDYPNYEVILADDSTDETIDIIKQWENHPRVKISRRLSRDGYKGGALREALKITESRAEFVLIFDADFIPYPDTITQFLKYFQYTAGSLDFTGTEVQGTRYKEEQDTALSTAPLHLTNSASVSNIAAVQGYQWHVLNKSENWITRGVRSEYSGSYVIERSGAEVYGGLKQISGSVYMIRRDVLQSIGWGTSITEDFELTLKLYSKGWKVVYTPYIQAPAEAVSTLKRLIRQRMRWAEGHSFNIKHMFTQLLFGQWVERGSLATLANSESRTQNSELNDYKVSKLESNSNNIILNSKLNSELSTLNSKSNKEFIPSPLTFMEKLELLYLTPYYLQAAFFILGTIAWLISETIFQVRLPFWTEVWGWSLVLTNLFALPLMNLVGLFMEESEDKDYQGLLSFVALSYIVAPFQAYAAIKGFIEDSEGPWFRTPKTGRITDVFIPGRFARIFSGIFKGRPTSAIASAVIGKPIFANNQYLSLATANNLFNNFRIRKKQRRWVGNAFFAFVVVTLMAVTAFSPFIPIVSQTSANTFDFGMVSGLDDSVQKDNMQKEANQGDVNNKDEIIKNALSKEINSPRSIIKELKTGGNIEFIFHKEPRVRIKFNGSEIDYETMRIGDSVIDPEKSLIFKDKEVIYQEVLKGIDIKYTINNGLITEEFIVKNREASDSLGDIKQSLKTSGLNVISTSHESFGFYLPDGKEALKFSDPFVRDNKGEIFRDIKMSLKKKGLGGYELSKTLNKNFLSWMNAEIRSYPVSIDPSVVVSGGIADGETQFGSMQRKVAPMARSAGVKIDDAGDPGDMKDSGSRLVRTSAGVLYAVINDTSDIEVYRSTDAVTWTEQDSADGPTDLTTNDEWAIAIDSSDVIHIVYVNNNSDEDIDYITFDTSSNQFGTDEQAIGIGSTGGQAQRGLDIALDSNGIPHVITCEYGGNNRIRYANRVGGSWNADILPDTGQSYNQASITINEDDLPEIAYLGGTDGLVAEIGDANNATSFTEHIVDTGAITAADVKGVDIEVDSSGNTWIVYVDETGANDYVTLVKHNDSDGWTTWQTPTHNSNVGLEPTLAIADNNVYVLYVDENFDVAWNRYNGSWAGETVRRAGTFQDVRARSANNFHNYDHSIDILYSDGTDIYWDSLLDNFYAFYNETGDISYKKSTDGGVQWNTAVTVDDGDTDNYNPTVSVSSGIIHAFWADDSGELMEGRRIDTTSSDAQGTLCQTAVNIGGVTSSHLVSVAALSTTAVVVGHSDTSSGNSFGLESITGLDGACSRTSATTGNVVPFGSGLTAQDRPVLVAVDSNTVDMIYQDGDLSYSRYKVDVNEWIINNHTIASVTHNVYSVASNGTTVWVLVADTTQSDDVLLYSCCTSDWAETTIDADAGGNDQDGISDIDMYCPTEDNCKIVYTDDIDTAAPRLMFVDCNDATCSSPTVTQLDADIGAAGDQAGASVYCVASDNCKIVTGDDMDTATPALELIDCTADEDCSTNSVGAEIDADLGSSTSILHTSLYCVADDNCKIVYNDFALLDMFFVDCADATCNTGETITRIDANAGSTPTMDLDCTGGDTDCKFIYHDNNATGGCADANSLCFVDCSDNVCANSKTVIDSDIGTTSGQPSMAIDCSPGVTDCKIVYGDVTAGDVFFVDCPDATCTSTGRTITQIDSSGGGAASGEFDVDLDCVAADDCKFTYVGNPTATSEQQYFVDCNSTVCTSGSVIVTAGSRFKSALVCLTSTNCKLAYYEGTDASAPAVTFADCDTTNCFPSVTDAADPWTSESEVEAVSLTYDSSNSDLYAHVIMDSSDQAYFKSTDATSISWGTEYSYNFTAGDLGQISATETAAGYAQIGISLRQGSNYEFSTLPENMWLISVFSPILIITSKKIKRKRKI